MGKCIGVMAVFIKDNGKKEYNQEKEFYMLMEILLKEYFKEIK